MGLTRTLASLAAVFASGCALITAAPPEVEVATVELRTIGLLEQTLRVILCVSNPNQVELSFRGITATLDVADALLAQGTSEAAVRLPPAASVTVPLTVTTTTRNLGAQLLTVVRGGGGIDYRLSGTVSLAGSLPISVPFSRRGRLNPLEVGREVIVQAIPSATRCTAESSAQTG